MTDKREDGFLCRMYTIGKNSGKAEKTQEAIDLLMDFLKKNFNNPPTDDFEKGFILGIRRAVGIIKDGGWE